MPEGIRQNNKSIQVLPCSDFSGVEYPGCVMDMNQLATLPNHQHDNSDQSESEHGPSADRSLYTCKPYSL